MRQNSSAPTAPAEPRLLELIGVSKHFGGVAALKEVDFDLRPGEIHGLVGENGAGKSTLIKILAGVHTDYEGEMRFNGKTVRFRAPAEARSWGIGTVYQELSVIRSLSVAENLFLGAQPLNSVGLVDWRRMYRAAAEHLTQLGVQVDVRRPVGLYSIGVQQMVEVARIIFGGASVIIMDEPTSALSAPEAERLFEFIGRLKAQGKTIIFISHFLEDVLRVSDRITVVRNGRQVHTGPAAEADKNLLVKKMLGDEAQASFASADAQPVLAARPDGEVVFEVRGLGKRRQFEEITFSVRGGETLGVYGFMGAGKTALANCLFGYERPDCGQLRLRGKPVHIRSTSEARQLGIAYLPNNRRLSVFPGKEVFKNVTLAYLAQVLSFFIRRNAEIEIAQKQIDRVGVTPPDPLIDIAHLSGGNQQKVILAKWLVKTPHVLILNEPTRGMDVGAKKEVMRLIGPLKQKGVAIILISSEPETILEHSDRILVMSKGRIRKETPNHNLSKEHLMQWA